MLQGIKDLMHSYSVVVDGEKIGVIINVYIKPRDWSIEALDIRATDGTIHRSSTWDVHDRDPGLRLIVLTKLPQKDDTPKNQGALPLLSFNGLMGLPVTTAGQVTGILEDMVLGDDSWMVQCLDIRNSDSDDPDEPSLYNIQRIQDITPKHIELSVLEPFDFDTPGLKWPKQALEQQYKDDLRRPGIAESIDR